MLKSERRNLRMCKELNSTSFNRLPNLLMRCMLLAGLCITLWATPSPGQTKSEATAPTDVGSAVVAKQETAAPAIESTKVDVREIMKQINQKDVDVGRALEFLKKDFEVMVSAQNMQRSAEEREKKTYKENDLFRAEMESLRAQAALRIVDASQELNADNAVQDVRSALLNGDTEGLEGYLQTEEKRLTAAGKQQMNKAAALARERAALAFCRSIEAAVAALRNAVEYEPDNPDNWWLLGDIHVILGNLTDARDAYMQMQKVLSIAVQQNPANIDLKQNLSLSYEKIGDVEAIQGNLKEALKNYQEGLAITAALAKQDPANIEWQRNLSASYNKIGDMEMTQKNLKEALKSYQDALVITAALAQREPANIKQQRDLLVGYNKIGDVQAAQGNQKAALKSYQDSITAAALVQTDLTTPEWQRDLSASYIKSGDMEAAQGNRKEALRNYQEGVAITTALIQRDPANTDWQHDLMVSYNKIGDIQTAEGDLKEALKSYQDGLATAEAIAQLDPSCVQCDLDVIISSFKIGSMAPQTLDAKTALIKLWQGRDKLVSLRASKRLPPDKEALIADFENLIKKLGGDTEESGQPQKPEGNSEESSQPQKPEGNSEESSQPQKPEGSTGESNQPQKPEGNTGEPNQPK